VVGCDRSKLRATLTDEGRWRSSSGGNLHGPVRSDASQSSWVDGASRERKWGRRRGAPVLARGKRANGGRRRATPFYGSSTARRGGTRQGVCLGVRPIEGGGGGPVGMACSRAGVSAGSGADAMEAGDSRAVRSCGSKGWGGANKWTSSEGGAQRHRERRKRGRVTGGTARFE
jgi:hypothetical protein